MKIMDVLVAELNKNRKDGEKVTRLHSKPYQICENGAHKDIENGRFINKEKENDR